MKCQVVIYVLCFMGSFYTSGSLAAQSSALVIDRIIEKFVEVDEETLLDDTYEDLQRMIENPINLNTCTREDLEQFFFLSPFQIENLLYYRYTYGDFYTLYELQLINGFDEEMVQFLFPFVYVERSELKRDRISFQNAFRYGKNQVLLRTDGTIQTKKGYTQLATDAQRYVGNPLYTQLRYRYSSTYLSMGVSMEKDAGEPFDWRYNKGFDFYAPHIFIRSLWKFKHIALGHYKLNFGQGLVLQSSQRFGKSAIFGNTIHKDGLSKSTSLNEAYYFSGIAATITHNRWNVTSFYSHTPVDGTLAYDDNLQLGLSSFKTDGIHRTESDFAKKYVANQTLVGGNIQYHFPFLKLGFTALSYSLDKPYFSSTRPYALYQFSGTHHANISVDYRARLHQFHLAGEMATDKNGAIATIQSLAFQPLSRFGLTALYRYYQPEYCSLFGNGFAQTSSTSNEEGLFIGTEILPIRKWKMTAYVDVFSFPWLNYLVNRPSHGYQGFVQTVYTHSRNTVFLIQFKSTSKEKNLSSDEWATPLVASYNKSEWRLQVDAKPMKQIQVKTVVQTNTFVSQTNTTSYGLLVYQDVGYSFATTPLSLNARFALFDAQNYDNRLYAYERDVLYAFSVPMYYGQGSRFYFNIVYKPMPQLACYLKFAHTFYADKTEIGSAGETIAGNQKSDIRFLVNWRF